MTADARIKRTAHAGQGHIMRGFTLTPSVVRWGTLAESQTEAGPTTNARRRRRWMRDQLSRKTLVPTNWKLHHGRIALAGCLVVLSMFLLVFGVPSTPAQTGQDARCAAYTGKAHGLCTAAVANGCFDGVQSPDCDDLTSNWNERCRGCDGPPPWAASCPCDFSLVIARDIGITGSAQCEGFLAPEVILIYHIEQVFDPVTGDISAFTIDQDVLTAGAAPACGTVNRGAFLGGVAGLTELQTAACAAAIQAVAVSLGVSC